jgi:hypothetical protein
VTSLVYLRLTPRSPHSHLSSPTNQPLSPLFPFYSFILSLPFPFFPFFFLLPLLSIQFWRYLTRYYSKCVLHAFLSLYSSSQFLSYSSAELYRLRFDPPMQITPLGGSSRPKQQIPATGLRGLMMIMTMMITTARKNHPSPSGTPCTTIRHFLCSHQMLLSA